MNFQIQYVYEPPLEESFLQTGIVQTLTIIAAVLIALGVCFDIATYLVRKYNQTNKIEHAVECNAERPARSKQCAKMIEIPEEEFYNMKNELSSLERVVQNISETKNRQ